MNAFKNDSFYPRRDGVVASLASAAGEVGPKAEANIRWKQEENRIGRRGGVRMRRKSGKGGMG